MPQDRVCLGAIAGAHGVKGLVKIKSFTARPEDIAAYGPLSDEAGTRSFSLDLRGAAKGLLIARVEGLAGREAAQALKGTRLYLARAALPPPEEEEYYHADLVGLVAYDSAGRVVGRVVAVHNYGAGDILEVQGEGPSLLVPFTAAAVPEVDIAAGRLVLDPPGEVEPGTEEANEADPGPAVE